MRVAIFETRRIGAINLVIRCYVKCARGARRLRKDQLRAVYGIIVRVIANDFSYVSYNSCV